MTIKVLTTEELYALSPEELEAIVDDRPIPVVGEDGRRFFDPQYPMHANFLNAAEVYRQYVQGELIKDAEGKFRKKFKAPADAKRVELTPKLPADPMPGDDTLLTLS